MSQIVISRVILGDLPKEFITENLLEDEALDFLKVK